MKHSIRWMVALVASCAICSTISYQSAYHSGYCNGYRQGSVTGLTCGAFAESLTLLVSLEKLRHGDIPAATRWIETTCFGRANSFFKYPPPMTGTAGHWIKANELLQSPDPEMARALAKGLSVYRAAYRTNSADWDTTEKNLDAEIAKIKSDNSKAWAGIVVTN